MQAEIVNVALGFLEGIALIISPCILPILPIIFAGSLAGGRRRPFGIILGFIFTFALFTFFSRKLVQATGIDIGIIRHVSYVLLFLLGIIMLSTYLTEKFGQFTQRLANTGSSWSTINNTQGGLISGMVFGSLIALIWTPCAGPILAAVIVQTVIQQSNLLSFLTLLAFAIGAGIPMLAIMLFGRKILTHFSYLKTHTALFRKILGAIIILSVGYMIYIELGFSITPITSSNLHTDDNNAPALSLQDGLAYPYLAPDISGIDAWINSAPLTLSALKGKVVLIDFWTYSCINCIRTLPYLINWYDKYHDKGLVIIGVHTPEFEFEKNLANVQNAVLRDGIKYPVALDSHFVTWQNFNNQYWPAHYLIDKNGYVVYTHFGEGEYDVTENNIRYLLGIKKPATTVISAQATFIDETPETYLGYARAERFIDPEPMIKDQTAQYFFPDKLPRHAWALQGKWKILPDRIIAADKNAAIEIHFYARNVYIVMGNSGDHPIDVKLLLNGKEISKGQNDDSMIKVTDNKLYQAVKLAKAESGVLQVISQTPGLEVYTFTFGE